MTVWRGYCGTGGKPAGNSEDKHDPNQSEEPIYSAIASNRCGTGKENFRVGLLRPTLFPPVHADLIEVG